MKALKILAFIVGGLLLLTLLLLGVALTPGVQTWAVRRALAGRPGINVEIGRVAAGISATELQNLRVVQNGLAVTVARISARYSAWDYLLHRKINVDAVEVRDAVVDARRLVAAPAPVGAKETAPGPSPVFALFDLAAPLPLDLRVGRLDANGRALLPGGRTMDFSVQGGGIAAGQQGRLQWKTEYADATKGAVVNAVHVTGSLGLHLTDTRRIDAVELETTVAAEGARIPPDRIRLSLTAGQPSADAIETVDAHLALVRQAETTPVFNAHMEVQAGTRELTGTWDIALRDADTAALSAGLALPEVAVKGAGKFAVHGGNGSGAASGAIEGQLSDLGRLGPQFAPAGALQLHAAFDGSLANNVAQLSRLEVALATAEGRKLLSVTADQPVSYRLADGRVELTRPGGDLAQIVIADLPLAWAQPFAKPVTIDDGILSGAFAVEAQADGRATRLRATQPLVLRGVTLRDRDRKLVEGMTISMSPSVEYTAGKLTAELPDLRVLQPAGDAVDGSISVQVTNLATVPLVAFRANLKERLAGVLRPFLPAAVGVLRVESAVEGALEGQALRLGRFSSTVRRDDGALVATLETLQALTVNLGTERAVAADPKSAAVRLRLGAVPLGLAEAFETRAKLTGALTGGTVELGLPGPDQLALQTTSPVTVRGLGLVLDGQPMVQGLDVTADVTGARNGNSVSGELRRVELTQGPLALLRLAGTGQATLGDKLAASGKGRLEADLAALGKQPVLASLAPLAGGRLAVDCDVTTTDTVQGRIVVTLRDLVARQGNQALGDLDVSVDAAVKPDGSGGAVKAPLTLKVGGRQSDLLFAGSFSRTASLLTFNGKLTSNQIIAADFRPLGALAPSPPPTAEPTEAAPGARQGVPPSPNPADAAPPSPDADIKPFWAGAVGRLEVDLKKIEYGRDNVISGLGGALIVEPTRLAVENLDGQLQNQPLKVAGTISFADSQPEPYSLDGAVAVRGLDVGAILRVVDPGEPPALESTVSVNAKMTGRGATLSGLLQNTRGQFDLTGSKGVLRALSKRGELAGAASALLGLVGALQGSDTTLAAGELAGMLKEMPFDSFAARLERGADLNLKLSSLEFISPTIHLTGTGGIQNQKGVSITDQPLQLQLQLAGKNEMATVLNRLRLLNGQQDEKKYYLMNAPFVVSGTLAKPDPKQLWSMVGGAAAGALLR